MPCGQGQIEQSGPHRGPHPPGQPPPAPPNLFLALKHQQEIHPPPFFYFPSCLIHFVADHTLPAESHGASDYWDQALIWTQHVQNMTIADIWLLSSNINFLKVMIFILVLPTRDRAAWRQRELLTILNSASRASFKPIGSCSSLVKQAKDTEGKEHTTSQWLSPELLLCGSTRTHPLSGLWHPQLRQRS